VLQCVAVCCSDEKEINARQHNAPRMVTEATMCCSVLQCVAVCCSEEREIRARQQNAPRMVTENRSDTCVFLVVCTHSYVRTIV